MRAGGYVAYGTRDEDVKGGGSIELAFNRQLTRKLTLSARHDVMQLGAGQNALTESNILSSILSRGDQRLSMVNRGEAVYEHEWCHGVSSFAGARMQRIFANRYIPMLRPDGTPVNSVSDAAVSVGLRLSKNETVYRMPFDKQSMGSVYPILTLGFTAGIPMRCRAATNTTASTPASATGQNCRRWAIRTSRCRAAASSARSLTCC